MRRVDRNIATKSLGADEPRQGDVDHLRHRRAADELLGLLKGVGEPGLVPTAPAIANAVYDAVGVRIYDLPITPEKVLAALERKRER